MRFLTRLLPAFICAFLSLACAAATSVSPLSDGPSMPVLRPQAAEKDAYADQLSILGVTTTDTRVVAVGDRGVVLLSDDNGKSFRQARTVPVNTALTDVYFADNLHGWIVGQWGVILNTTDGGETWAIQRIDVSTDRPIFSVYFKDPDHGFAVGLWALLLETHDGGHHWIETKIPRPTGHSVDQDLNFFKIFSGPGSATYISAEHGFVLKSADDGRTWEYHETGFKGSLWSGAANSDGTLLVSGLRGAIYRSVDAGVTWARSASGVTSSIVSVLAGRKNFYAATQDGATLISKDDGLSFEVAKEFPASLTALGFSPVRRVLEFSTAGPLTPHSPLIDK